MSKNKIKKLKNAFMYKSCIKNNKLRIKRLMFYTSSQRYYDNKESLKLNEY